MQVQPRDNIVLIGFMGSGKSAVGKALARKLQIQFMQVEKRVEVRARSSIRELITQYGEPEFRKRETKELRLLQNGAHKQVIEAGAGVVMQEPNHELLRALGWVIHLHAEPDELFRRYSADPDRPMLKKPGAPERFASLHAARAPLYIKAAHSVLDTSGITPVQIVDRLRGEVQKIAAQRAAARHAALVQVRPDRDDDRESAGKTVADAVMNIFDLFG
jgi:shikimate kinase